MRLDELRFRTFLGLIHRSLGKIPISLRKIAQAGSSVDWAAAAGSSASAQRRSNFTRRPSLI
jgi:hypothetical protein